MISIVIPTHNREDLLERAVRSVLNQTIRDIEIIVVSDGSTDNTDQLIRDLQQEDERIVYEAYPEAKGANYARNKGIQLATNEYIAFLDDDDEWAEDKLQKQLDVFKGNEEMGLVYTGSTIIYVNEELSYENIPSKQGDLSKDILFKNLIGTTSTVMVKSSVIEQAGSFDTDMEALQDYDLWIRICQITKVGVVKEACINYYNYTGKKQISQHTEKYEKSIEEIEKKYQILISDLSESEKKERQSNSFTLLANKSIRNNSKKHAIKYSIKSFTKKPSIKGLIYIGFSLLKFKNVLKFRKLMSS